MMVSASTGKVRPTTPAAVVKFGVPSRVRPMIAMRAAPKRRSVQLGSSVSPDAFSMTLAAR